MKILRRFGHRGSVLVGFAITCTAYGTGILLGYRPTFTEAYTVPVPVFGWVFLAVGVFAATGALAYRDSAQYAVGVAWTAAWAMLITTHWTAPYGWAAAVSWLGICLGLLLSSAWPNAPQHRPPPPLPTVEELVSHDQLG